MFDKMIKSEGLVDVKYIKNIVVLVTLSDA